MSVRYHVTSVLNRDSIRTHGLDWRRMGAAPGIAGSRRAEQEGCFLGEAYDADYFVNMNNTGGSVDVWGVVGVDVDDLVTSPENYFYVATVIAPDRLRLIRRDLLPRPDA